MASNAAEQQGEDGDLKGLTQRPITAQRLIAGPDQQTNGSVDNWCNLLLERDREETAKKWNFDFANDCPLEGDWVWERVEPEGDRNAIVNQIET